MLPPRILDETLKPFATETQWAYYEAFVQEGSLRKAALLLGRAVGSIQPSINLMLRNALAGGWVAPQPEMVVKGTSTLTRGDGSVSAIWEKTRIRGLDREEAIHLADPKKLVSLSTMTDGENRVIAQWAKEKPEDFEREKLWELFAETLGQKIPAKKVVKAKAANYADFLSVYPVGDHHHGMLAWAAETGAENYDIKISQDRLATATRLLIDACPPSEQALIPFLGDFFHTDGYKSVTPQHGNLLDSDVRFPKMFELGCSMVEYTIDAALEKHKSVHVIWETGNHDPTTAAAMRTFLRRLYRDNPRVTIDTSPQFFHYYRFGKVLLGTNHGDKVKPAQLAAVMAADRAVDWGETTYRMWMTGHVHHEARKEFPGCFWESFGVLAPLDAYAAAGGWRSICQMQALVFHKEHGLAGRSIVTPGMFEAK